MTREQPYLSEQGNNERLIIEEMIHNPNSEHWEACNTFVVKRVYAKTKNMHRDDQEEIMQDIMYKATKYLPSFRFECTFKSWLYQIIEHCITDKHRKFRNEEHHSFLLISLLNEKDVEGEELWAVEEKSTEEVFEIYEKIRNGVSALFEYAKTHSHPERNQFIIKMVILEGYTHVETAGMAGCDPGVVGYVVREAQRYARQKWR